MGVRCSYFDKAIGVCPDNGDVSFLRILIALRGVLSDGKMQYLLLRVCSGIGILSDMLALDQVVFDNKSRVHDEDGIALIGNDVELQQQ